MDIREAQRLLEIAAALENFKIIPRPTNGMDEILQDHSRVSMHLHKCVRGDDRSGIINDLNEAIKPVLEEWRDIYLDRAKLALE